MLSSYTDPRWQGSPAPVEDYEALGFRRQGGHCWRRLWIPADMARHYAELGLSPEEAVDWGVIPTLVEAYREAGIHEGTVGEWVRQGIMPNEARFLIRSNHSLASPTGYLPPGTPDQMVEDFEEEHGTWYDDGLDQSWYDGDWPEPQEPYDPDERYYRPDDPRHPHSPYDPFDLDGVIGLCVAEYLPDAIDTDVPADPEIHLDGSDVRVPGPRVGSAVPGLGTNVIPLFQHRVSGEQT